MSKKDDAEVLDALTTTAAQYRAVEALADELRGRRDLLVIASYRRAISLRRIATAAGVHYTRVQQLTRAADAAVDTGTLRRSRPRK